LAEILETINDYLLYSQLSRGTIGIL